MDRSNHYESAFEGYLQWHRYAYVAVDETRRSFLGERRVKSLDFILHGAAGGGWLVDVKGRRFPAGRAERPRFVWECWVTQDDIASLVQWSERFGADYRPLFVFLYELQPFAPPLAEGEDLWTWHDRRYVLKAVPGDEYREAMRPRSPRWGTVYLATDAFRRLARPLPELVAAPARAGGDDVPF
jgi:hypothetical protein